MHKQIALRLTNATSNTITLLLEPWGDQREVCSGATLQVEAQGPNGDTLEVEYGENTITVYGWFGSTVRITAAGHEEFDELVGAVPPPLVPTQTAVGSTPITDDELREVMASLSVTVQETKAFIEKSAAKRRARANDEDSADNTHEERFRKAISDLNSIAQKYGLTPINL